MRVAFLCVLLILILNNSTKAADRNSLSLAGSLYDDAPAFDPVAPVAPPPSQHPVEDDPFAPAGIALGSLVAFPALMIGGIVTDNVERSPDGTAGAGFELAPRLRLESEWPRHRFFLDAAGETVFHAGGSGDDRSVGWVDSRLGLDIRKGTTADISFGARRTQTQAGFDEVPDESTRDRTDVAFDVMAGLTHARGLIGFATKATVHRALFEDVALSTGGHEDNDDRDYTQYGQGIEVGYETAGFRPFVGITGRQRRHDKRHDRSGLDRDSRGIGVEIGVAMPFDGPWSGRIALAYDWMDYEEGVLPDYSGPGLAVDLNWRPTPLTLVRLQAASNFEESVIAGTSGYRTHSIDIAVSNEARENLTVDAALGTEWSQAIGSAGDGRAWKLRLAATYRFNRMLGWVTAYEFAAERYGSDSYTENRLTSGLEITP